MLLEGDDVDKVIEYDDDISKIDSSLLKELVEALEGTLWQKVKKWIENHAVGYAVGVSVKDFKTLEARGLAQAQCQAYLDGLRYIRGLEDAIKREYDRRVRAIRTQQDPPVPTRRTGIRPPSEYATLYNDLFGEGPRDR